MKMKLEKALNLNNIINAIDVKDLQGLNKCIKSKIILMQVQFSDVIESFNKSQKSALDKVKKEGFDDRASKYNESKKEDKSYKDEEFEKELDELNKQYNDLTEGLLNDEVELFIRKINSDEFADLIELLYDKEIKLNGHKIESDIFCRLLAVDFVSW